LKQKSGKSFFWWVLWGCYFFIIESFGGLLRFWGGTVFGVLSRIFELKNKNFKKRRPVALTLTGSS
ncbi:hypothetical protein, partial [Enterobacter intestinihominis]